MPEHSSRRTKYTTLYITAAVEGESRNMYFRDGLFGFRDVAVVARTSINHTDAYIRKLLSGQRTSIPSALSITSESIVYLEPERALFLKWQDVI